MVAHYNGFRLLGHGSAGIWEATWGVPDSETCPRFFSHSRRVMAGPPHIEQGTPPDNGVRSFARVTALVGIAGFFGLGLASCASEDLCARGPSALHEGSGVVVVHACLHEGILQLQLDSLNSVLRLGATAGEGMAIHEPASALILVGGGILLADRFLEHRLRVFEPGRGQVAVLGRRGHGPGEFIHAPFLYRLNGDTVAAVDYGARRLTVLSPNHDVVGVVPLAWPSGSGAPVPLGQGTGGDIVMTARRPPEVEPSRMGTPYRDSIEVFSLNASGGKTSTHLVVPGSELANTSMGRLSVALGRRSALAVSQNQLHIATNEDMAVRTYSLKGELERVVWVPGTIPSVTRSIRREYLRERLNALRVGGPADMERREEYEQLLRATVFSSKMPWVDRLLPGQDSTIWMVLSVVPGSSERTIYRLGATGIIDARLVLPAKWVPLDFRDSFVLVAEIVPGDTPRFQVFRTSTEPVWRTTH